MHRTALELDSALDFSALPDVASSALRARILEITIRHTREAKAAGWFGDWNWNWKMALFALTPCVVGFLSGSLLMDPSTDADDAAWDELAAVVMPATLGYEDELDMFDEESP
jgi:hypothetical protein